ncbi:hypothetical protein MBLNU13_g00019t1 [Cladosporium sp. NU13]
MARRLAAIDQEIERVEQDTADLRSRTGGAAYQQSRRLPSTAADPGTPAISEGSLRSVTGVKRKELHERLVPNDRIRVPMRKPDPYKGKTIKEHMDWIARAEIIFQQAPSVYIDGFAKVIWASQYLDGEVRDRWLNWWTAMTAAEQHAVSWDEFVLFLADELDDPVARLATAHEKYAEAKQREGQNARTFLTYLETLETQMTPYTEDQKLYHYFSRLRKDLRLAITDHNLIPATRRELCSLASQLEKNLQAKKSRPIAERITSGRKPEARGNAPAKPRKRENMRQEGPLFDDVHSTEEGAERKPCYARRKTSGKSVGLVATESTATKPSEVESAEVITTVGNITYSGGEHPATVTLDTGAQVTLISQKLALQLGLPKAVARTPQLKWLANQHTHCYGAYGMKMRLRDDVGREEQHEILMYGVDQGGTEVLLGRHTLRRLGIDIQNGPGTWRYGLRADEFELVDVEQAEKALRTEGGRAFVVGWVHVTAAGSRPVVRIRTVEAEELTVPGALQEYADVFNNDSAGVLPSHRTTDHVIELQAGKEPPYGPLYNLSARELEVLREYIKKELELGRIRYSTSPAGAPLLFVPKKDGTLRLCVDYRALNSVTIKDRCPLPLIDETLSRLTGAYYFTSLDLKDAYYRIRIREGDEWKTAFRTRYGHFEYMVMPFGLTNAPASFQAYINRALAGLLDDLCVVYLDDILIYTHSKSLEEHWTAVKRVLARLRTADLYANLKKCTFAVERTHFLGFIVTRDGVEPDPAKVATIQEWPAPRNLKELQGFLGFANFYRRFIAKYSIITSPLTKLLKGGQEWCWPADSAAAFEELKSRFASAEVMRHYDPTLRTKLETDASAFGISGILSQLHADGKWRPVAFASRKLTDAERNWEVYDQELLAIVHSFKTWRHYLSGAYEATQVYTDHNNLKGIQTVQRLNQRQARWAVFLGSFDFEMHHRVGKTNPADGPSRRPDYWTENDAVHRLLPTLQRKMTLANGQTVEQANATVVGRVGIASGEYGTANNEMLDSGGEMPPKRESSNPIAEGAAECMQLLPRAQVRQVLVSDCASADLEEPFLSLISKLQHSDETVIRERLAAAKSHRKGQRKTNWKFDEDGLLRYGSKLFIPNAPAVRMEVIATNHDSKLAGHFGKAKTVQMVSRSVYWPGLHEDVQEYVRTCAVCQRCKTVRTLPQGALEPLPVPKTIWEEISLDFITKLPPSMMGEKVYDSILVVVDRYSKMAVYIPAVETWTAKDFADVFMTNIGLRFGLPLGIVSDRGALFTSKFWTEICYQCQIRRRLSTAYHPQTDGQTERQNQTLEAYLRMFAGESQADWATLLKWAEFAYNNAPHSATGLSPFQMVYGKSLRWSDATGDVRHEGEAATATERLDRMRIARAQAESKLRVAQAHMKARYDQKHVPTVFCKGDRVLLSVKNLKLRQPSRKLSAKFVGPFEIVEKVGQQAYRLRLPPKYRIHDVFHISLLKAHYDRAGELPANAAAPDIDSDGEEAWEVEKILDERLRNGQREFLLRWKGYSEEWDSWQTEDDCGEMGEMLTAWKSRSRASSRPSKRARTARGL